MPINNSCWRLLLLVGSLASLSQPLHLEHCHEELGASSGGSLPDTAFTASSSYDEASVGPKNARLNGDRNGGAWCSAKPISRDLGNKEWVQVDLGKMHVITAVFTQGRFGNGRGAEFIEAYTLYYWRPGMTDFFLYRDSLGRTVLPANDNTYTIANNTLEPPIFAQKVRLFPFSEQPRTPCVRLEYVGCVFSEGVVSYAIPQGMLRGSTLELMDHTYDGKEDPRTGELRGGLGQLVDGHFGYGNFKTGGQGLKGYEWLGWKRKSNQDSVNLVFAFDQVRTFQRVDIHTNNHFTKDIQVFRQARVYFSNEEDKFGDDRVVDFKYMPDLALENARNVSINLKNSHGQYCMLQLFFNAKWILVSEITFYSTPKVVENQFVVPKLRDSDLTSDSPIASDQVEVAPIDHPVDSGHAPGDEVESSSKIGIIIGVLITVIFLLVMGITFMLHQARVSKEKRSTPTHLVSSAKPEQVEYLAMATDKPTNYEETIYEEPLNCLPSTRSYMSTEDLTDEYAEPGAISLSYSLSENIYAQANRLPPLPISHYARPCTPPDTPRRSSNSSLSPHLHPETAEAMAKLYARLDRTNGGAGSLTGFTRSASIDTVNVTLNEIDPKLLTLKEKLGNGQFGEIHLCTMKDEELVAVKFLQPDCDPVTRSDFENEARILSSLRDPNLVRVLGVCYQDAVCMVCEYSIYGDLCQYLLDHVAETTLSKSPNVPTLSYGCLIYVASQIASGMKYLESLNFVHRDLAARNCLVGPRLQTKICDYGMSRSIYKGDYYRTESGCLLPIRWMSWESVLLGKFTTKTDVWAFGVTLWEILTFARMQPYESQSDAKVLSSLSHMWREGKATISLSTPHGCPREVRDLMNECLQRDDKERPSFSEIHLFLQRKNLGFDLERELKS